MDNDVNIKELREKIIKGLELAFERLIKAKSKTNGKLAFSKNGKIIIVNAKDLVK